MTENEIIRKIKAISIDTDHRFSFIAKYILQNLIIVPDITIKEMAEYTYTSVATINRFTKFLELDGYKELIHIIKYFNHNLAGEESIMAGESNNALMFNTYHNIIRSLHETFRLGLKQKETINKVITNLKTAQRIVVFAVGGTYNVAKDFQEKLLRVGFNIIAVNDFHNGYFLAQQLNADDLAFFVSYSGETLDLIKLAKVCQQNQTPIVVVCRQSNNTLSNLANYEITISSNESIERLISTTSRFALLFGLDMIYFALLATDLEHYRHVLEQTLVPKF
ncbi:GntR family transcriptional regulator [Spiroplasma sp. NBRC 100390]|uniref:MurR/RpiR family transcriptional regulator n=1 Tax=unclassified Spiroplasma TaxID=2637901 RepID=UPI0008928E56|nr:MULTISPECIES: MurR/RpiR family transcriptional regulator [unclassified Spiroplasma]AOX44133.1 GntR family transcriptional regulator [Spiroplasma sp. TU-14]APE13603.1 GntR family transcriptional regulator [Spiroplasma sp. NBRC 100390]